MTADRQNVNARNALIEAAVEEFSSKGYASATLAGIAERAGVTTGAVYAHFQGKLDLLLEALGLRTANRFLDIASDAASGTPGRLADVLAQGLIEAPLGRRGLILLDVIVFARSDPEVAKALSRMVDVRQEAFVRATGHGVDAGRIDPDLPYDELARLVMALSFGMLVQRALGEPTAGVAAVSRLTERLLHPTPEDARDLDPRLARVRGRAAAVSNAQAELVGAIREAADAGLSLRKLGKAAGLSHEHVRRLLAGHDGSPPP